MYRAFEEEKGGNMLFPKVTKLVACCLGFILFFLFLVMISFYFVINGNLDRTSGVIGVVDYVQLSLNRSPIKSIIVRENGCDIGEERLPLYTWKGTIAGCQCSSVITTDCTNTCTTIPSQSKQYMYKWRSRELCIVRYTNAYLTTSTCPTNYKRCNPYTCVYTTENCPITSIEFALANATGDETIAFDSTYKLIVYRVTGDLGIQSFKMAVDSVPCLDENYDPPVSGDYYPLYSTTDGCGEYGQDTIGSAILQEDTLYNFIAGNGFSALFTSLPLYQASINSSSAILYSRKQLAYKAESSECSTFKASSLTVIPQYAQSINNTGYIFMIVNFILIGLFLILVMIEFIKHRGKFHIVVPFYSTMIEIFVFMIAFSMMYQGTELIPVYQQKDDILVAYKALGRNSCFSDSTINSFFSGLNPLFSDAVENFYLAAYVSFYFGCVILFIMFVLFIILLVRWCRSAGESGDDQPAPKKKQRSLSSSQSDEEFNKVENIYEQEMGKISYSKYSKNPGSTSQPYSRPYSIYPSNQPNSNFTDSRNPFKISQNYDNTAYDSPEYDLNNSNYVVENRLDSRYENRVEGSVRYDTRHDYRTDSRYETRNDPKPETKRPGKKYKG